MDDAYVGFAMQLLLIAVLILINAFFSSAEMAIVSVNKHAIKRLAEEGNKNAIRLQKLMKEPIKFLSAIQVGITFAGFFSSAYAATGISDDLGLQLAKVHVPYSEEVSLLVVTLILSFVTLVCGELYPKRLALKKSQAIALFSVRPILFFLAITAPFVKLLSVSTNLLIRITGLKTEDMEEKVSREELQSFVDLGKEQGTIDEIEKEMLKSIFEFDNILAYEVMTPRTEVYMVDIGRPVLEIVEELVNQKHTKIPVYAKDRDNIIGVLHMKDLLQEGFYTGFANVNLQGMLRKATFVHERKHIDELFRDLQRTKKQMAVLVDEHGGFSGIVTLEDLIEEIVGNIDDEDAEQREGILSMEENTFLVDGRITIEELNKRLGLKLDEKEDGYETLGGLLIMLFGYMPKDGEACEIQHQGLIFKVEKVKDNRIDKVKIIKKAGI